MNNPFQLNNRTVLVTGASSGIGRQVAISCSEIGARVVITGRDRDRLNDTYKQLRGNNHLQFTADLLNEAERAKFAESVPELDGVVHCAGIVSPVLAKYIEEKHIRHVIGSNFEIPMLLTGKLMRSKKINKGASFVFISSVASKFPYNGGTLYSAAKAALEAYSRNLAFENYNRGVRSNCIVSAMIDTPMYEETIKGMQFTPEQYASRYPLGIGKTEDVANAVIFFLSDASRWVTGSELKLDGGYTLSVL